MHHDELWQIFAHNGTPLKGKGARREAFAADPKLGMGNSHIWFWRSDGTTVKILLQKRSMDVANRPGWYHISAGGHINVGESPVEAAVREANEEMGLAIDPEQLFFVQAARIIEKDPQDIVHVYLYRLDGDENFIFNDGEAGSFEWRTLQNFKEITQNAEANNLVPQGQLYFGTLIAALEYAAAIEDTLPPA